MQTGRSGVLLTLVSFIAITLSGCSAVGEDIEVEAPSWRSGYAWSYAFTEAFDMVFNENGDKGNHTENDEGRFVRQVTNTTLKAGDKPVYVMVEQSDSRKGGRIRAIAQEDLGYVDYGYGYSTSCVNGNCGGTVDLQLRDDADAIPWPAYLDFPLKTGKSWGKVIDLSEYDAGAFSVSAAAAVEGAAVVDLPVGPTTAAKVNHVMRPTSMAAFEDEIRAEAAEEGYSVSKLEINMEERETIYYSAQYQAIVKRDVVSTERFYARGTDPEGEPFEFSNDFRYSYSEVLDGARLASAPELSPDEMLPYLTGQAALKDPSGSGVIDGGYSLVLSPAAAVVNAGAGESATFKVALDGASELPSNHTLHWVITDVAGKSIKTGEGKELTATVSKPGRYAVNVEARQGKSLVSADSGVLSADWIATSRITCPAATVGGIPQCPAGNVPAHTGIKSLTVRAVPTGPLGALPGSAMTVYDADGRSIAGRADGNGYKVEITDFSPYALDGSDWTMLYRHSAGVASDIDMQVEAIYSGNAAMTVATTSLGEERIQVMRSLERLPW